MVYSRYGVISLLVSSSLVPSNLWASSEYQQWLQQQAQGIQAQKQEFQDYKDQRDKEFTAFLKANWKAVDVVAGEKRDPQPKPVVMPVAPEVEPAAPVVEKLPDAAEAEPAVVVAPEPVVVQKPVVTAPSTTRGHPLTVNFYGRQLRFYYDKNLEQRLTSKIDKDAISDYWSKLSRTDYEEFNSQLEQQRESLQLNDWAYASLINQVALAINNQRRTESALLSWFLLVKSGYQARIAYNHKNTFLLVPSRHELFDVSYFTFNDKRYYAVDFVDNKQVSGQVFTYDGEYPDTTKVFDMQVSSVVASNDREESRRLSFEFEGRQYDIDVNYDQGRIMFFSTYPQLDLDLYFSSAVYDRTATPLLKQLAVHMQGMTEQQAVNFLLRFVQTSFKYATDEQQFGEENYLFPEETLFYPYSDCEDRSILFAWLVRGLLGLEVVGLDYPGHVATAVRFKERVKGDHITYKGAAYTVADPTYINASAGMTMPDFKRFTPDVIAY